MRFSITTLGCKVNAYESQFYAEELKKLGFTEVEDDQESDICIINTCTVTNTAAHKSRQKIHQAKRRIRMHIVWLLDVMHNLPRKKSAMN